MHLRTVCIPTFAVLLAGCGAGNHHAPADDGHGHGTTAAVTDPHAGHDHGSGGIDLSATVQKNLGITWATAEYRVVQGVLRMPGRFEAEPSARRPYQSPLEGRIEVLVKPYQRVAAGDPLYRLHSEAWQRLQLAIAEGCNDGCPDGCGSAGVAARNLAAGERQADAVAASLQAWSTRATVLARLEAEVGGKSAELAEASTRVADLTVQMAEAQRQLIRLQRDAIGPDGTAATGMAAIRLAQMLAQAAAITGLTRQELEALDERGVPLWMATESPIIRAASPGLVEGEVLPSGTWIDARTTVLTVTDPTGVRLRAAGLQADLPQLSDGLQARIVATDPALTTALPATLVIGPIADAIDRSVDLIARPVAGTSLPAWVRPGVTANLEVVLAGSQEEELAIPVGATIRDGLDTVMFRRDPRHPDAVIRIAADLGTSDGRWVVVHSGLKEGDQVVLGGIYPLKLSQQQGGAQAGHFEADGTFHTGKH
jgi:hypothetical protein